MRSGRQAVRLIRYLLLLLLPGPVTACNVFEFPLLPSLPDQNSSMPVPSEIKRVRVILYNQTYEAAVVDIGLDQDVVTYPVQARQIIVIRLKCAETFTFAAVRFTDPGRGTSPLLVGQQARRDVDYDCDDVLLISLNDQQPRLKVVPLEPPASAAERADDGDGSIGKRI